MACLPDLAIKTRFMFLILFFFAWGSLTSFPPVHLDDLILIDVFEDVRRIDENANSASGRYGEKHVQLQTIDDHGHILPILTNLKKKKNLKKRKLRNRTKLFASKLKVSF
jgi:hypothetical protein